MKDFTCCDLNIQSLHDLMQHLEEAHAHQGTGPILPQGLSTTATTAGGTAAATSSAQATGAERSSTRIPSITDPSEVNKAAAGSGQKVTQMQQQQQQASRRSQLAPAQDMEAVEDMEMDDDDGNDLDSNPQRNMDQGVLPLPERQQFGQRQHFGNNSIRVPPLDLSTVNTNNHLQNFQGLRQSQPGTPVSGGRAGAMYNNPTVSSVNTPTLNAHPLQTQQQLRGTPDSSAPGTPAELDAEFLGTLRSMSMENNPAFMNGPHHGMGGYGYGGSSVQDSELYIDEPAKRLFSANGGGSGQRNLQGGLGSAQYGPNSEIARRIREQQRKVGLADTVNGLNGEEPKPFRCPVIGCEKAYKNQNGLKYHKAVRCAFVYL